MKSASLIWQPTGWESSGPVPPGGDLILFFGAAVRLRDPAVRAGLRKLAPTAVIAGCTTAGEICGTAVTDDGAVALLIAFETTKVGCASSRVDAGRSSFDVGWQLAQALAAPNLRHVLIFSDGLAINGTALAEGLRQNLPAGVSASGGLAGDGSRFAETMILLNDEVVSGQVVAVGLYGENLRVRCGSAGGWSAFGPRRLITRSKGNVLYELDGQPALALYKTYLGERANGLPATGLFFPLELLPDAEGEMSLVRTILGIDEARQSLTFAGDVPMGRSVRLMKATIDRLIFGAEQAGTMAKSSVRAEVALLVSCVGRRLLLNQRVEEEVEAVLDVIGNPPGVIGFYSYGEIGPAGLVLGCELHNQTMTLTTLAEIAS